MASFMQRMIIFVLILTIAIPISMDHKEKTDRHRRGNGLEDDSDDGSDSGDDSEIGRDEGNDSEIGRYLKDLCSDTKKPKQCWKIIKPEISRFIDTDNKNVAGVVVDLAIAKSDEINDQLNQLHRDSRDNALKKKEKMTLSHSPKEKYISCSKNYNDAIPNLVIVRRNLDSSGFQGIPAEVDDAAEELKSCKHELRGESFDPAHIRDRNKEFGNYLEIVRAATNRFMQNKDRRA